MKYSKYIFPILLIIIYLSYLDELTKFSQSHMLGRFIIIMFLLTLTKMDMFIGLCSVFLFMLSVIENNQVEAMTNMDMEKPISAQIDSSGGNKTYSKLNEDDSRNMLKIVDLLHIQDTLTPKNSSTMINDPALVNPDSKILLNSIPINTDYYSDIYNLYDSDIEGVSYSKNDQLVGSMYPQKTVKEDKNLVKVKVLKK